jgi:hypothetical protein
MKRLVLDESENEDDCALAKTAAKLATPQRSKTRRIDDIQQGEDMAEPP